MRADGGCRSPSLGLRSLYFALAGIVSRSVYLKHALSLVLVIIGAKMADTYRRPRGPGGSLIWATTGR
jgi:hypothetical protein